MTHILSKVKISWLIWKSQRRCSVLNLPLLFKLALNRTLSMTQIQIKQKTILFQNDFKLNCHLLDLNLCHQKRSIKASLKRSGKFKTEERRWLFQISQLIFPLDLIFQKLFRKLSRDQITYNFADFDNSLICSNVTQIHDSWYFEKIQSCSTNSPNSAAGKCKLQFTGE